MKQFILTFVGVFLGFTFAKATPIETSTYRGYSGNSYIFVEGGVEFSVFPDGQFDFVYLGNQTNVSISTPNVNISYNSGYNYDAYVQYDMYGAVIQVESVPIYYDAYGRIIQAGSVEIRYHNSRITQVGGLTIFYNPRGYFSHYVGYINPYNRYYVYRPWHVYYTIPSYTYCIVYSHPYRRYYTPIRYTYSYHRTHRGNRSYVNGRRTFYNPGSRIHYQDGRTAANPSYRGSNRGDNNTTYTRSDATTTRNVATNRSVAQTNRSSSTTQRTAPQQRVERQTSRQQTTQQVRKPVQQRNAVNTRTRASNNNNKAVQKPRTTVRQTHNNTRRSTTAQRTSTNRSAKASTTRGRG